MSSVGTGQLSQGLNEDKLQLSVVELGTTSGTGSLYFILELVAAVCGYLNLNFRSLKAHYSLKPRSFPWLGLRL